MGSEEDYVYQLRRTGASASYPNIKDVMKLKMGVTRFGRSTDNDYYLDSAKLKNFISRSHAEIHAKKSEDGQYVFVLHNKGLNGTFINDIKMNQFILLQEGDKITFGHTNGFKLEPGQRANQPNSEFEFVFEKVPARFAEADSTSGEVRDGKILSSPEHKKSPKSPKSPSKLKRQSDINSYLSKHSKDPDKVDIKSHDSSVSPDHRSYDISSPEAKYSEQSMSPLIPQPQRESSNLVMSEEDVEDQDEKSDMQSFTSLSESVRESKKKTRESKTFSYVEDSDDDDDDINDNDYLKTGTRAVKPKATRGRKKSTPQPPKSKSPPTKRKVTIPPIQQHKNSSSDEDELPSPGSVGSVSRHSEDNPYRFSDDSDSDSNKKIVKPKGRPPGSKNKLPTGGVGRGSGPKPGAGVGRGRGRKAKIALPPPQIEFDFAEEDFSGKKRKKPLTKPTELGSDMSKKKRGRQSSSTAENYSELEDGVEWYEEEKCSAVKCKRPKNKRVKWVQCDLCDEWYHTVCVGCQYEMVKDNNIDFSCGYCQ